MYAPATQECAAAGGRLVAPPSQELIIGGRQYCVPASADVTGMTESELVALSRAFRTQAAGYTAVPDRTRIPVGTIFDRYKFPIVVGVGVVALGLGVYLGRR